MKIATTLAGLAVLAATAFAQEREGDRRGRELLATLKKLDAAKGTLVVQLSRERDIEEKTLNLTSNVKVTVDGKEAKLADLAGGMTVRLTLSPESGDVLAIQGEGPTLGGAIHTVDAASRSLTLASERGAGRTLAVAPDAKIVIDGRPADLSALKEGARVSLKLSSDGKTVLAVTAGVRRDEGEGRRPEGDRREAPAVAGVIRAVDPAAKTVTLVGDDKDQTFSVHPEARIVVDGRAVGLADLKPGSRVTLRLTPDRQTIVALQIGEPREGDARRPEGERRDAPLARGVVKSVDAAGRKITLVNDAGEQTFEVHREARINLEEIRPGARLSLRLTPDRGTVLGIEPGDRREGEGARRPEGADREGAAAARLAAPLFALLDADRDGKVTKAELEAFLAKYDKNKDGVVTAEEFGLDAPPRREERRPDRDR